MSNPTPGTGTRFIVAAEPGDDVDLHDPLLADVLAVILEVDRLVIEDRRQTTEGTTTDVSGTADVWGDLHTTVTVSYESEDRITELHLTRPIDMVEGLDVAALGIHDLAVHLTFAVDEVDGERTGSIRPGASGFIALGDGFGIDVSLVDGEVGVTFDLAAADRPPTFDGLVALLGGDGRRDLAALPPPLDQIGEVEIRAVSFWADPEEEHRLTEVAIEVLHPPATAWTPFAGFPSLTVDLDHVLFGVRHPLDVTRRGPELDVVGVIQLAGAAIEVTARTPAFEIAGALADGATLSVGDLLEALQLADLGGTSIVVDELEFSAEPHADTPTFRFDVSATGRWKPVREVEIGQLGITISRAEEVTGAITATMTLAGVALKLSASHGGVSEGWAFSGSTADDSSVPLPDLADDLTRLFDTAVTVPHALAGSPSVEHLTVEFDTASHDFTIAGEITDFRLDGAEDAPEVTLALSIAMTHQGEERYEHSFAGTLHVGELAFEVDFEEAATVGEAAAESTTMLATFTAENGVTVDLADLVRKRISAELPLPTRLPITIEDAMAARVNATRSKTEGTTTTTTRSTAFVFGFDIGAGIDLSGLPLVGAVIPAEQSLEIAYRLLVARGTKNREKAAIALTKQEITDLNGLLPSGVPALPERDLEGFTIAATLQFGTDVEHLDIGLSPPTDETVEQADRANAGKSDPSPALPVGTGAGGASDIHWTALQKSFGPVQFRSIGVLLGTDEEGDPELGFFLDASLSVGALRFTLDGLGASSPLDRFAPTFELRGLGLDYSSGPAEIGGSFLRDEADAFKGAATIRTEQLSLAAVGAYTTVAGHPSLFVYAVLDEPIGGPSFFFVTGVAAGFGYNRTLVVPPVGGIKEFPLVAAAMNGARSTEPATVLASLGDAVPPSLGEYFLAVGVAFNSFKMVDSFALLIAQFKEHFEIDVVGVSKAVVPTPDGTTGTSPVAVIEIALRAAFVPDAGSLAVDAQLTPASHVISERAHLSGGAAFYSWFSGDHAGDFVATVGGYHPSFARPAHYPAVPRLALNWPVSDRLTVKGDMYFALAPQVLMAGGHLAATWREGNLQVTFALGVDLLIAWKPYHYTASAYVHIGGTYTFEFFGTQHISLDVGADLEIWGPDFAGRAEIEVAGIPFEVRFGPQAGPPSTTVTWDAFRTSFLPAPDKVCVTSIVAGLVGEVDIPGKERWIISPAELHVGVDTAVPVTSVVRGRRPEDAQESLPDPILEGMAFGVAPVEVASGEVESVLWVGVERDGAEDPSIDVRPTRRRVPAAMWGDRPRPGPRDPAFVEDLETGDKPLTGVILSPARRPHVDSTAAIDVETLQDSPDETIDLQLAPDARHFTADATAVDLGAAIATTATERQKLVAAWGLDPSLVHVGGIDAGTFTGSPTNGTF